MGGNILGCCLCGFFLGDFEDLDSGSWWEHYRVVHHNFTEPEVSGVGQFVDPGAESFVLPANKDSRWDDPGYQSAPKVEFSAFHLCWPSKRPGFVFHEACWSILQQVYQDKQIPLARILEVFHSLPVSLTDNVPNRDHNYEGLVTLDDRCFPWYDELKYNNSMSPKQQRLHPKANPYEVVDIDDFLKDIQRSPPGFKSIYTATSSPPTGDFFVRLPFEIYNEIASYLPTADVLGLRLVSRAFVPIYWSQAFWRTRFWPNSDRGFLFEIWHQHDMEDWRALYRRTSNSRLPPGLQNRQRVWKLGLALRNILDAKWMNTSSVSCLEGLTQADFNWKRVSGKFPEKPRPTSLNKYPMFHYGCQEFKKGHVLIPHDLAQIVVYLVRDGDAPYISGLKFISAGEQKICLGYCTDELVVVDTPALKGFTVAVGLKGIRGLQIMAIPESLKKWIGSHDRCPQTKRLITDGPLIALEAGFDGFKLVSLAAGEERAFHNSSIDCNKSLHNHALWYPKIPSRDFCLSDMCLTGQSVALDEYRPLCWVRFGGLRGDRLRSLREITIPSCGLPWIRFHYAQGSSPVTLGRGRPEPKQVSRFSINGPSGEIIENIEIQVTEKQTLKSFKASVLMCPYK
ncbi:conserved hypothetical protein [Histoplasma capsulatum G186AR]|uniref:F-box domain-containing protein n=2 Tax=Ajellomyces capsulatus TaxID=5037 RepID=C0ND46_AJECG|nr:uncharacterized protein HCBG_01042 [Histoplasma capsulatum G186AR]EEH11587.1 conserved hypothetical protein [Histoplasma capsulatum G186AR]